MRRRRLAKEAAPTTVAELLLVKRPKTSVKWRSPLE